MRPVVRHLIACEDIRQGSLAEQFTLVNVVARIRSLAPVPFPLLYGEMCVLAMCTECRGKGRVRIRIVEEETGESCRDSPVWPVTFTNDPLNIVGFPFRIGPIEFRRAGAYKVQLVYNGDVLAEEPILVSE